MSIEVNKEALESLSIADLIALQNMYHKEYTGLQDFIKDNERLGHKIIEDSLYPRIHTCLEIISVLSIELNKRTDNIFIID